MRRTRLGAPERDRMTTEPDRRDANVPALISQASVTILEVEALSRAIASGWVAPFGPEVDGFEPTSVPSPVCGMRWLCPPVLRPFTSGCWGLAEGVHQPLPDVRFATPGAWRPISKSPGHRSPPRFSERPTGAIWPGTTCAAAFA
jgi:hypothetical protein